jgi:exodeoxyribonuclease V alpha subunit
LESISGSVERVTFVNPETGWTVARLRRPGRRELVTIVGNLVALTPGESLELAGAWEEDPRYGTQFRVERYRSSSPSTTEGIRRYLGSGLIRGIGPKMAERLVEAFGDETLQVIEENPNRMYNLPGFGKGRVESIKAAWQEQREIRNVMVFLQSHGVGAAFATKIYRRYGDEAIDQVQSNPYRLAIDIDGIGFLTADRIAARLGIAGTAAERVEAGVLHVLQEASSEGHVFLPETQLVRAAAELLDIDEEPIQRAIEALAADDRVVAEPLDAALLKGPAAPPAAADLPAGDRAVYVKPLHVAETQASAALRRLRDTTGELRPFDVDKALSWAQQRLDLELTPHQSEAVRAAVTSKLVVVTGGPGTGKSTIVRSILAIVTALRARVALAAPTGRAAKRLSELTGHDAKTIHRLLEFSPKDGGFQRNADKPLKADVVIVDEASMVDVVLLHHLVKAIPARARLVLVGDVDQLPSVGPGAVLRDLIASHAPHVVWLDRIFRQAEGSWIVTNAHRINQGEFPEFPERGTSGDFFFVRRDDPEEVRETILDLCRRRLPHRYGLDPVDDIQVLTPMHRGVVGTQRLNADLQELLNRVPISLNRGNQTFKLRDKVIQTVNDYDKDVYNGDIGRIVRLDADAARLAVEFEGRRVWYEGLELDELAPAYAISIHKSQGSEYPAVVIPITTSHYVMLQRNLLYTAVTRGKRLVVLVGSAKALAIAIRNARPVARWTGLSTRMR